MGYSFSMYGNMKFDKKLPKKVLETFAALDKLQEDEAFEVKTEEFKKLLNSDSICGTMYELGWCPWRYDSDENAIVPVNGVDSKGHNYWFIEWICWLIESVCIPNDLKLNGYASWQDDNNYAARDEHPNKIPTGDGKIEIIDNVVKVKGTFYGSDDWRSVVRKHNKSLGADLNHNKPTGDVKGTFCITGKVSLPRDEFKKLGIAKGFEFKPAVSKGLTYLVCDDPNSTSSKIVKAKKLGINVVSESDFKKLLGI